MKTSSLIKALEKHGLTVEMKQDTVFDFITQERVLCSPEYWVTGNAHKVHWYDQNGSAVCVQVQKNGQYNDSQRDYFPGFFANTIKIVIKYLTQ